ncbi:MAG TPA: hypothetical protein VKZ49_19145 [Polyangiaceae bacterium]|nr:hypothetical protein [Polyangiaceae bacterium]
MFFIFLLIIAAVAVAVYLAFIFREVPGVAEQRLGSLAPLPEDLGKWRADTESEQGQRAAEEGLKREVRILHVSSTGLFGAERLVHQARYRDAKTNQIVRIDPERSERRRRVR